MQKSFIDMVYWLYYRIQNKMAREVVRRVEHDAILITVERGDLLPGRKKQGDPS